jgi:ATP-binding cassette subfamily B (MDR/TAP) protein 1
VEIRKDRTTRRLWLSQCSHAEKVLERFNIDNAKPMSTPLPNYFRLSIVKCPKINDEVKDMSKVPYASVI